MNNPTPPTPSRVSKARNRLENAVATVEAALDERASAPAIDLQVEQTLVENEGLREANAKVSQRLDTVIDRLKSVLEE